MKEFQKLLDGFNASNYPDPQLNPATHLKDCPVYEMDTAEANHPAEWKIFKDNLKHGRKNITFPFVVGEMTLALGGMVFYHIDSDNSKEWPTYTIRSLGLIADQVRSFPVIVSARYMLDPDGEIMHESAAQFDEVETEEKRAAAMKASKAIVETFAEKAAMFMNRLEKSAK